MGMYDSIIFSCPNCKTIIEEQSKAGNCELNRYSPNEVPWDIANDVIDSEVWCHNCESTFTIRPKIEYPKIIPLTLV